MTAKRSDSDLQVETLLKDVKALLGARPNVSKSLKESILTHIQSQIQSENKTQNDEMHNVKLVQIPSLGEFGELSGVRDAPEVIPCLFF